MKKLTNILIVLLLATLCLAMTACGHTEAELAPYLSVSYTGYNGNGTAHVDFDFAAFEYSIMSQWKDGDTFEKLAELTALEMTVTHTPTTAEQLSNGDSFTVTIEYDEDLAKDLGYRLTATEKTFTVEGLAEPIVIDPFAPEIFGAGKTVDCTLEGIDPFIMLTLRNTTGFQDPISHITYRADKDWNLKNGDTVTVTATMEPRFAQQGYLLERTQLTISVEGFDRYASSAADLNDAILQQLSDRAYRDCVSAGSVDLYDGINNMTPWGARFENIHVGDTALLAVNREQEMPYSFVLVPVYKTVVTDQWYDMDQGMNTTRTWEDVVAYYQFSDVIIHADGSITFEESYVEMHGNYTDTNAAHILYLDELQNTYTFQEVAMP